MSETTCKRIGLLVGLVLFVLPFVLPPLLPHSHAGAHTDWQCLACQVGHFLVAVIFCAVLILGTEKRESQGISLRLTPCLDTTLLCQGPRGPPLSLV